jgi:cobalt-zinc-cadmium efflux system membrane fusion protein
MKRLKLIILISLIASCQGKEGFNEYTGNSQISIRLNKRQILEAKIKTDSIRNNFFPGTYCCKGYLYLPPDKLATVSAPLAGFIRNMYYNAGDYVKKGTLLAVLKHHDYIKIQKDYIETKSQVTYYIEDFKRQGDLALDHASSIKKMQRAQADYRTIEAKLKALKAQLKLIGINADKLEKEGFTSTINIYSPINGFITKVEGNIGKFVDSYGFIYEISDINDLNISFELPARLFSKVSGNMDISFNSPYSNNKSFNARISNIGQVVSHETNTFRVFAKPDSGNSSFRPGMAVDVKITLDDVRTPSLPENLIVRVDNKSYVFIKEDNIFTRINIKAGNFKNGFAEIIEIPDKLINAEVVVLGAQYLNDRLEKY